jgi:tetratricopeptide (TPR) repeat protein
MRTRFFILASVCVAATIALVFAVRMQGSKPQAIQVASPAERQPWAVPDPTPNDAHAYKDLVERLEAERIALASRYRQAATRDEQAHVIAQARTFVTRSIEFRLCDALFFFWFYRGYWSEGRAWLADVLECSSELGAEDLRGRAMQADGWLAVFMGDHQTARTRLEESVSILRQTGNTRELAAALVFLAYEILANDHARAHALVEEGIHLLRQTGDKFALAMSLNNSGTVAFVGKDYPAAHVRYAEAAELGRELGDNLALGASLRGLGIVAIRQREFSLAASHLQESLLALREIGDQWFMSRTLDTLAEMYSAQGAYERAARLLGAAATAREAVGAVVLISIAMNTSV